MRKLVYFFIATFCLASVAYATDSQIWGEMRIANILGYGQEQSLKLGPLFTMLQGKYFAPAFLAVLVLIPAVFYAHYAIVGPKVFPHDGKKIHAFSMYNRIIHQIAGVSFVVIVPTGYVMMFGSFFGGGAFVALCKDLHTFFTIPFAIVVLPMTLMWVKYAFFNFEDVKWLMILGGYLSKEKKPIMAGKFNCGQKMWFWIATLGSMVMVVTGATMFFMDFNIPMINEITGLSQIDLLRAAAILHNVVGIMVTALFFTHIYMSMFAIKGAVHSIINGYMEEEEVRILHNTWYNQLKKEGKV